MVRANRLGWTAFGAAVLMVVTAGQALAAQRAKGASAPQCSRRTEGEVSVGTVAVRSRGARPFSLEQTTTYDAAAERWVLQAIVRQGQQVVLELEQRLGSDASASGVVRYGRGFKGIREVAFTRSGPTAEMVVDGRRTAQIVVGADARSVRFEDGTILPRLKVRRATRKGLLKVARQAGAGCSEVAPQALAQFVYVSPEHNPGAKRPEGSFACVTCQGSCAAAWMSCLFATFGNPYAAAVATGLSILGEGKPTCLEASAKCLEDCHNKGGAGCCPVKCEDSGCWEEGAICCGKSSACEAGDRCADPARNVCCSTDAGESCGYGCCAQGHSCRSGRYERDVCCPPNTGEPCGAAGCCPSGQRCYGDFDEYGRDGRFCCDDKDICGDECCAPGLVCTSRGCLDPRYICANGDYCPDPGVCQPNGGCCQGGQRCGDQCCNAFGSSCCNGQCCDGSCVGGVCCPAGKECGASCCPADYACADPESGSCVACDADEHACPFSPGSLVTCCASGQECCTEGCCAPGMQCCRPPGSTEIGCNLPQACVR